MSSTALIASSPWKESNSKLDIVAYPVLQMENLKHREVLLWLLFPSLLFNITVVKSAKLNYKLRQAGSKLLVSRMPNTKCYASVDLYLGLGLKMCVSTGSQSVDPDSTV